MNAAASTNKSTARSLWLRVALGLLIAMAGPAGTATAQPGDDTDPPARAGRVSEVIGDAWLFDVEAKEWTRVGRNQTIAQGDRLRTDERARVSLRIGSTSLWLDERSDLEFARLDEGAVLLQLDKGDLGLRLRSQDAVGDTRVLTREGEVIPEREGLYRVEQLDRGSRAFVWQGGLRFESARGGDVPPVLLQAGEQAEFWWADGPRVERQRIEGDSFGDWMVSQSRQEGGESVSQRYVSPEMTGAEDLDRNGRWEQASDYGAVWIPTTVVAGWVPYRDGRWVWTRHWGWSWVDDAPWGFAPFHYGRWVQWGGRWCWAPGRYVARPVYAPALVAWVGGGSISVGIGIGGRPAPPRYGWYPLAPREAYAPAYRHTPTYMRRINNDHDPVTVQRQRPRSNREVAGAISYLPGQGAPARPLPPINGQQPVKILPGPPARSELAVMLPQRPAVEARPAPANMPWRSENIGPGRQNRDRDRDRDRDQREREPVQRPIQGQQQPQQQQQQAMPVAVPPVRIGIEQPPGPPRPTEPSSTSPGRGRERGGFERGEPYRPPVSAEQMPAQQQQRQTERSQERSQERGERGPERGGRGIERQPQPQPQQVQAQPQPQPQRPQPQVQMPQVQMPQPQPPRSEAKPAVPRGRPDSNKHNNEAER